MKMNTMRTTLLAAFAVAASPLAGAATIERQEIILSSENCQPALPAFDGNIRKRPLAMQNEGTTPAFVTCAFRGIFGAQPSQKLIQVGFISIGDTSPSVSCTLVDGRSSVTNPIFIAKTTTVPAGSISSLTWTETDNDGAAYIYPALSCSLPPSIGIRFTARTYDEEIGD